MSIKKIAIIGFGSIGQRHFTVIKNKFPNIEPIIVRSNKKKEDKNINCKIVYSLEDVIKLNIQAAIIASPATFHIEQAIFLASHNIHLLIEKPLSHNLENIDKLKKIIKKNNLICKVGYVLRNDPNLIKFKQYLDTYDIGTILDVSITASSYLPNWRPDQNYKNTVSAKKSLGGGVILELSHEIDYIQWLFGIPKNMASIIYNSNTLDIDTEDSVRVLMTSNKNYPISLFMNFCSRKNSRICEVLTCKGVLMLDLINQQVVWYENKKKPITSRNKFDRNIIFEKQLENFFEAINNNLVKENTLSSAIDVLKMINKIYKNQINS
ncbi:hypothetical protein DID75_00170 [Candidatus Marinamargulisbacteria bacterium SCGC AG-410-N11]|nr:hypothetical protein DID75_00170 [Candidatus Marinamargulisbacteria bacterium SCGC AG-410-N11]